MLRWVIAALGGAGLMYLLDPVAGRRRRALMRDKVIKYTNDLMEAREDAQKHLENKAQGMVAETRSRLQNEPVSDETLVARVRSQIGRVVTHSRAIEVSANDGRVTLSGNILASEVTPLLKAARAVQGVKEVENQLQVHEQPGNIPDLQRDTPRSGEGSI